MSALNRLMCMLRICGVHSCQNGTRCKVQNYRALFTKNKEFCKFKCFQVKHWYLKPGKLGLLFHISHLLDMHAGGHYSVIANAICTLQMYGTTAIKVGVSLLGRWTVDTAEEAGVDAKQQI